MKARIFIDATSTSIGGGYTYLVNVIPRICERAPDSVFRILLRNERLHQAIPRHPNLEIVKLPEAGVAKRLHYIYFEAPKQAAAWHADLFFSVGEMAPRKPGCPSIASFRNGCVFSWQVKQPVLRERLRLIVLWLLALLSVRWCERILFVSHDSARWIGDSVRLPAARRAVVHHGIDADTWSKATPHPGPDRPYILTVGSIYTHKNFVRLIEAYVALARRHEDAPDLLIIGDYFDRIHERKMLAARQAAGEVNEKIHILGAVPHAEVQSYYAGATVFVFPSYLETFGHPMLEAMAAKVPTVASDMPVFREIAGDAALYADPFDVPAIARAMEQALDPKTAADLVHRGGERVREFSLDHTVERLLALFVAVLAERRM